LPRMSKAQEEKRDQRIREYTDRGYPANRIQKELQNEGLGMQRKVLLERVRHYRGRGAPKRPERHIPIKYRRREHKHLAFYGTYRGDSRRISVVGSGRELYKVAPMIFRHPPRKQFLVCSAEELDSDPDEYLIGDEWDDRPEVES